MATLIQITFPQDLLEHFSFTYHITSFWDIYHKNLYALLVLSVFNLLDIAEHRSQIFCPCSSARYITQVFSQSCTVVTRSLSHSYCLGCYSSTCPASPQCLYWQVPDIIALVHEGAAREAHIQGGLCCGGRLVYLFLCLPLSGAT